MESSQIAHFHEQGKGEGRWQDRQFVKTKERRSQETGLVKSVHSAEGSYFKTASMLAFSQRFARGMIDVSSVGCNDGRNDMYL